MCVTGLNPQRRRGAERPCLATAPNIGGTFEELVSCCTKEEKRKLQSRMSIARRVRAVAVYEEAEEQGHRLGKDPALAIGSMILL